MARHAQHAQHAKTTSSTLTTTTPHSNSKLTAQSKLQRAQGRGHHHHDEQHHHDLLDVATADAHSIAADQPLHPAISRRNNSNNR